MVGARVGLLYVYIEICRGCSTIFTCIVWPKEGEWVGGRRHNESIPVDRSSSVAGPGPGLPGLDEAERGGGSGRRATRVAQNDPLVLVVDECMTRAGAGAAAAVAILVVRGAAAVALIADGRNGELTVVPAAAVAAAAAGPRP